MMDYLKPLIWVLLVIVLAFGLHLLLTLVNPPPEPVAPVAPVAPTVAPMPPGPEVLPPPLGPDGEGGPIPPTPVTPPVGPPTVPVAGGNIDRVARAQWQQALTAAGFAQKVHPKLHAGQAEYESWVFASAGQEVAWVFLETPGDDKVVRLEFYVDGPETVPLADHAKTLAGCVAVMKALRALDQTLAERCGPVLFSPYTDKNGAYPAGVNSTYLGFARDVGNYIALRLTARNDMPGGQFLLLWKDPEMKVGARKNSVDFADKCKDAKWDTFAIPNEAK